MRLPGSRDVVEDEVVEDAGSWDDGEEVVEYEGSWDAGEEVVEDEVLRVLLCFRVFNHQCSKIINVV